MLSHHNLICLSYTTTDINHLISFLIFSHYKALSSIFEKYRLRLCHPENHIAYYIALYLYIHIYIFIPHFDILWSSISPSSFSIQYSTFLLEIELNIFSLIWQSSLIRWKSRMNRFKSIRVFTMHGHRN